ncbi:RNA polymerase sigma-70 factor, ECF subfamily protein [Enhygromyxa salina]|uniref:RNA polymerase sigma-70 factor, ECF subfamily protein n=1 Tax=Enhygromyxa salina TaxID=215803 RepID=A0A0C2D432_9BACT|nr:sigma-70 family RNA polymerase sigma factor [Enhygromyxa salina]KIG14857.1 RNA polymerase sigma-70 factor, ECF subfamily protein [Enhygromyxa salina]
MLIVRDPLARRVRQAVAGDRRAFTRLYRELHPLVARFIARRVDSRADAEELVAEVFRRVVEHLGGFDPSRGSVRAWVLRIARNAVIDHYRTRKSPVALEAIADGLRETTGPLDHLIADERTRQIREILAECPEQTRQLLAMRYGDGLRHAEIAELLGLRESAVRKRISRAISELRTRSRALEDEQNPEVSHAL